MTQGRLLFPSVTGDAGCCWKHCSNGVLLVVSRCGLFRTRCCAMTPIATGSHSCETCTSAMSSGVPLSAGIIEVPQLCHLVFLCLLV